MKKYETISRYIRERIENGELKEGMQLETEEQLAAMFECSRPTVRQAIGLLERDGLMYRITGKGTFITRPKNTQEYTRFIESYPLSVCEQGSIPKAEVLDFHIETADPFIQQKLGLTGKQKAYLLKCIRYDPNFGNDLPLLLTEIYLPCSLLPNLRSLNIPTPATLPPGIALSLKHTDNTRSLSRFGLRDLCFIMKL